MSSGSFKDVITKICVYKSYIHYMYKQDLVLNNPLGLVGFYDILTLVGYLMPNPVYTYTEYKINKRKSYIFTVYIYMYV